MGNLNAIDAACNQLPRSLILTRPSFPSTSSPPPTDSETLSRFPRITHNVGGYLRAGEWRKSTGQPRRSLMHALVPAQENGELHSQNPRRNPPQGFPTRRASTHPSRPVRPLEVDTRLPVLEGGAPQSTSPVVHHLRNTGGPSRIRRDVSREKSPRCLRRYGECQRMGTGSSGVYMRQGQTGEAPSQREEPLRAALRV